MSTTDTQHDTDVAVDVPPVAEIHPEAEETTEELAPLTLAEAIANIEDGSRMIAGTSPDAAVEAIAGLTAAAVATYRSATEAAKKAAAAIARHARREVLLPDGRPDWAGMTPLSETIVTYSLDKVLNSEMAEEKGERRRVRNRIMQHVRSTYLELEIRDYVASSTTLDNEQRYPDGPDDSDPGFLADVRKQYLGAGLAVPSKYQSPEEREAARGAAGSSDGPRNPVETVRRGVEALGYLTPQYRAARLLQAISTFVAEIQDGTVSGFGSEADKAATGELLSRTSTLALYGARIIDNATKGGEADEMAPLFYSPEHDDPAKGDENEN